MKNKIIKNIKKGDKATIIDRTKTINITLNIKLKTLTLLLLPLPIIEAIIIATIQ